MRNKKQLYLEKIESIVPRSLYVHQVVLGKLVHSKAGKAKFNKEYKKIVYTLNFSKDYLNTYVNVFTEENNTVIK